MPQSASRSPVRQVSESQQPLHDDGSQMQVPLEQCWPETHGLDEPHRQAPAVQESVEPASQTAQLLPAVPHELRDVPGTQVSPAQHPPGHVVASQMQAPPEQRWPKPQALPEPHRQMPEVQVSLVFPQSVQAPPPVPHAPTAPPAVQVLPTQHPTGHEVASQTQVPEEHRWPAPQAALEPHLQVPPTHRFACRRLQSVQLPAPDPQVAIRVPFSHTLPLQQPDPHPVASHTHPPETQCSPTPHGPPSPHPQPEAVQMSAATRSQMTHVPPPVPHAPKAPPDWHAVPVQQPDAHEVPSQTQFPLEQCWPAPQAGELPHMQTPPVHRSELVALQVVHAPPS